MVFLEEDIVGFEIISINALMCLVAINLVQFLSRVVHRYFSNWLCDNIFYH